MKTKQTNLGVEYDIEVMSIFDKQVELEVRCEEGQKTFYVDIETVHDELTSEEVFELLDYSKFDKWVNAQTVGFISSELAKLCVMNSNDEVYWCYLISRHNMLDLNIYVHDYTDGTMKILKNHTATGEQKIKELLTVLKG